MSDNMPRLTTLAAPHSPKPIDLRCVGAHPNYWYPVAWCDELKVGKTLARRFAGEPIVLYRGASGNVFALEDRCAHRQVPLHLGVVEGDELKCHYHTVGPIAALASACRFPICRRVCRRLDCSAA